MRYFLPGTKSGGQLRALWIIALLSGADYLQLHSEWSRQQSGRITIPGEHTSAIHHTWVIIIIAMSRASRFESSQTENFNHETWYVLSCYEVALRAVFHYVHCKFRNAIENWSLTRVSKKRSRLHSIIQFLLISIYRASEQYNGAHRLDLVFIIEKQNFHLLNIVFQKLSENFCIIKFSWKLSQILETCHKSKYSKQNTTL